MTASAAGSSTGCGDLGPRPARSGVMTGLPRRPTPGDEDQQEDGQHEEHVGERAAGDKSPAVDGLGQVQVVGEGATQDEADRHRRQGVAELAQYHAHHGEDAQFDDAGEPRHGGEAAEHGQGDDDRHHDRAAHAGRPAEPGGDDQPDAAGQQAHDGHDPHHRVRQRRLAAQQGGTGLDAQDGQRGDEDHHADPGRQAERDGGHQRADLLGQGGSLGGGRPAGTPVPNWRPYFLETCRPRL